MNHDALPAHNLAMIVSEFPKSTHAYRRGFCSDVYQNIISARIHLKEFNDHFLIRDAEEIAYSLVSMIGFTMDDEMIIDDFYNCTCLDENLNENINNRCFTIYNNENCLLHRLLHRFGKVDCLHKSYKYFNGFSVDPICGNGVIERGEVCDPGPEIYGVSWSWKILKNLSTSVNLLYDQRTTSTSKSKFLAKSGKTIIGDSGTMSSNNTTNSGHSRTIIGLTKDNEIKKFNNEKDSSKIEEKSLNTLPLIIKSSDDVNLSIGTSSEATSNLLNNATTTTTANSFTDTLSTSDDLSGVFVTRTKNGRLNQPNHFPKIIKSRKNNNLPSPLASYSSNVDSLPRIVLTGNP
uniref:tRNA-synt_2b domain-containing protein n=1 Tax=Parastrongyloides trichosuri TaxID=131310 RepID=A0A0N4ZWD0_PARTI